MSRSDLCCWWSCWSRLICAALRSRNKRRRKFQSSLGGSGFGALHQEHQRNQGQAEVAQQPEYVDVAEHGGLPGQFAVNDALSLRGRERGAGTGGLESGLQAVKPRRVGRIERGQMPGEYALMGLSEALLEGSDQRNSNAAAHIAGQVDQTGGAPGFFAWDLRKGRDVDRHEQESQAAA